MKVIKCTCENGRLCKDTICIIDYAGNNKYPGFCADWCPNTKKVYFGGTWYHIPPMEAEREPTEDQINEYINKP